MMTSSLADVGKEKYAVDFDPILTLTGGNVFLSEVEKTDLRTLIHHQGFVLAEDRLDKIYHDFQNQPFEYLAVLRGGHPLGICSKGTIGFLMGSQFGFAIHGRQTAAEHMLRKYLAVKAGSPLRELLTLALGRSGEEFYNDVMLLDEGGAFLGLISIRTLVGLQSRLIQEQVQNLESQGRSLWNKNKQLFKSLSELRQMQGRYGILFENSAVGVALLNGRGETLVYNQRFGSLFEFVRSEEEMNEDFHHLFQPSEKNQFLSLLEACKNAGMSPSSHTAELRVNLSQRGRRIFKFLFSWIRETGQVCICVDDITEQRLLERQMATREKQALLESLVGGIAHEINNKLAPIAGFADLLISAAEGDPLSKKHESYCEIIKGNAMESAKIINQLLLLSKPYKGDHVAIDLGALVRDAKPMFEIAIRNLSIDLEVHVPQSLPRIVGDPIQIKQVLMNLVLNAKDAMQNSPRKNLGILLREGNDHVLIEVKDTGCGIPPGILSRIFDPFFTTKGPDKGTGLGLSVCLSIIKQHNGEIRAESTEGEGTTFKIHLPLALPSEGEADQKEEETRTGPKEVFPAGLKGKLSRFLVVDDEEFIGNLLQEMLRTLARCTVETEVTAEGAMKRIERENYDIIISDIRMPEMNGLEFYERVRRQKPELASRFFFITGEAGSAELSRKAEDLGIPVLRKPFSVKDLFQKCQAIHPEGGFQDGECFPD